MKDQASREVIDRRLGEGLTSTTTTGTTATTTTRPEPLLSVPEDDGFYMFYFKDIYQAYLDCRKNKRNKKTCLKFELNAEQNLLTLTEELNQKTYYPRPSFCFVAKNDKHREVFAADFTDRVVHHYLVHYLEKIWEPVFIYDSYACRKGKGTHSAVKRLQTFTRKVTINNTCRAWFLQLDIKAFFPSIDRQILLSKVLSRLYNNDLRWLSEMLILHDPTQEPIFTCPLGKWREINPHKSLFTVPTGKGLAIGNLTSQFFANVYLNELDQFIKHILKAKYYLRYVDDFVILHKDRKLLLNWKNEIQLFLEHKLELALNPNRQLLRPVTNGINFVGYIVRPTHFYIRNRVVGNCHKMIQDLIKSIVREDKNYIIINFPPDVYKNLYAKLNSYIGIFSHASTTNLVKSIFKRWYVLQLLFFWKGSKVVKRWSLNFKPANLYTQYRYFAKQFQGIVVFQVGGFYELYNRDAIWLSRLLKLKLITPRKYFYARIGFHVSKLKLFSRIITGIPTLYIFQTGNTHHSIKQRIGSKITLPKKTKDSFEQ